MKEAGLGTVVLLVVATTAVSVTVTATPVAAMPVRGAAFVLADQADPLHACYTPNPTYSMNTSDVWDTTGRLNEVCHLDVGRYRVRFANLGIFGGVAHVTAFTAWAASPTHCKIFDTAPHDGDQIVNVACYSVDGVPLDSMFSVNYTSVNTSPAHRSFLPDATFGYLRSLPGIAQGHCEDPEIELHSQGRGAEVCKVDAGVYTVAIHGQTAIAGNMQVTAYGGGSVRCKLNRKGPAGIAPGTNPLVRCFDATGAPADSAFTFSYVTDGNILGGELCCHPNGHDSAYAWAFLPTADSYDPGLTFQFNKLPHFHARADRLGRGRYTTHYDSNPDLDHSTAIVTADGRGPELCNIPLWNRIDGIRVNCFDQTGTLVDTAYMVAATGRWQLG